MYLGLPSDAYITVPLFLDPEVFPVLQIRENCEGLVRRHKIGKTQRNLSEFRRWSPMSRYLGPTAKANKLLH